MRSEKKLKKKLAIHWLIRVNPVNQSKKMKKSVDPLLALLL